MLLRVVGFRIITSTKCKVHNVLIRQYKKKTPLIISEFCKTVEVECQEISPPLDAKGCLSEDFLGVPAGSKQLHTTRLGESWEWIGWDEDDFPVWCLHVDRTVCTKSTVYPTFLRAIL